MRFDLDPGLHLYGSPVSEGMIPTSVELEGPDGIVVGEAVYPETRPLRLPSLELELPVFDGSFDVTIPFYADGRVASETRPLDQDHVTLAVRVRYQACDDEQCLLPKSEVLRLDVPLDVVDVPKLGMHLGHGQREASWDATPHMLRMLARGIRQKPTGFLRFIGKSIRLELAARRRRRS
ncbi:MAG: protein-disulfide reductase DsbD family protein [Myxococcota bacterium]|nr:protein-disulfide reductase DsbD family protein [Myxococcota bacterium]